jgi:hypothetical protein
MVACCIAYPKSTVGNAETRAAALMPRKVQMLFIVAMLKHKTTKSSQNTQDAAANSTKKIILGTSRLLIKKTKNLKPLLQYLVRDAAAFNF